MSFSTSVSGTRAAQAEVAAVSNNLANARTTGFKRSRAEFGDLFVAGGQQNARTLPGQGTRLLQMTQEFAQGTLQETGRALDLAVAGEGFFVVKEPAPSAEIAYTRAGSFRLDTDRFVVDGRGSRVQLLPVDANGEVVAGALLDFQMPAASPTDPTAALVGAEIDAEGLVECSFADGTTVLLGKVALASFSSPEGLRQTGDAHWRETVGSGPAQIGEASTSGLGEIRSSALEGSNIDVTEEMVALMVAQRNFQANAKALEIQSALNQTIVNLR